MQKLLLLDLDGTIREPLSGAKFINHPRDQKIIAGADKAISHYHKCGWLLLGISNQGGVAAGHKTLEDCILEQTYTLELFPEIHKIYFCPDYEGQQMGCVYRNHYNLLSPDGYSSFRKPGAGMLEYAVKTHEADQSWFIGDRPEDEQAAEAAGVDFLHAETWRNRFRPGMHSHEVTPHQLQFLEGIPL